MILTCPACSAKYMVSTDTIGIKGRSVRCARCKHEWFQKSEKDSLDDLISRIQAEEFDEISFDESKLISSQKKQAARSFFVRLLLAVKGFCVAAIPGKKELVRTAGGMAAALIVFSLCAGLLIAGRTWVAAIAPQTVPFYVGLGLQIPVEQQGGAAKSPEDSLAFDRLEIEKGDKGQVVLTGMLINLTSSEVAVPALSIQVLDGHDKILLSKDVLLDSPLISPESQVDFRIVLVNALPEAASKLEIKFGEISAHEPRSEQHQDSLTPTGPGHHSEGAG